MEQNVPVLIRRLDPGLPLPAHAHPGDAGLDLFAATGVRLEPGQRVVVPTGIAIALPDGYAAFIHPRSGLAARHGVTIVNAPGTEDATIQFSQRAGRKVPVSLGLPTINSKDAR